MPDRGRLVALVGVVTALLVGCTSVDLASVTGLWVSPTGVFSSAATDLELDVVYVGDVQQGCWSATGDAGMLPVRWPEGTVVGLDAVVETGEHVVADGATIAARGVVRAAPEDGEEPGGLLPAGCDLADGWYDLTSVTDVLAGCADTCGSTVALGRKDVA